MVCEGDNSEHDGQVSGFPSVDIQPIVMRRDDLMKPEVFSETLLTIVAYLVQFVSQDDFLKRLPQNSWRILALLGPKRIKRPQTRRAAVTFGRAIAMMRGVAST